MVGEVCDLLLALSPNWFHIKYKSHRMFPPDTDSKFQSSPPIYEESMICLIATRKHSSYMLG